MDMRSTEEYFHFLYDPQVYGYSDSFFKTLSGVPSIAANKIRLSAASVVTASEFCLGEYEFMITVPVAPVAAQLKTWGLYANALAYKNDIYFSISGANFTAVSYNSDGTAFESTPITWDAAWTAAAAEYKIKWFKEKVEFYVNDIKVASHTTSVPNELTPVPVHVYNFNADNLDVSYIRFANVRIEASPDEVGDVSIGTITVHADNTQIDDTAFTSGDKGTMALGVRADNPGTLASGDGDYTPIQIDAEGRLRVYDEMPLEESWVDTTAIVAGTHYYPGVSGYTAMLGYRDLSITGYISDLDNTTSLAIEATNDDDPATANWIQVYGWDTKNNTAANVINCITGTVTFSLDFDNINYRFVRARLITGDNTNTVIIKARRK